MLLDVIAVWPRPDFQLDLEFQNGERCRFDARPLPTLKPWPRIAFPTIFNLVRVDYVWPGEIDIAPETLYDDSTPLTIQNQQERLWSTIAHDTVPGCFQNIL